MCTYSDGPTENEGRASRPAAPTPASLPAGVADHAGRADTARSSARTGRKRLRKTCRRAPLIAPTAARAPCSNGVRWPPRPLSPSAADTSLPSSAASRAERRSSSAQYSRPTRRSIPPSAPLAVKSDSRRASSVVRAAPPASENAWEQRFDCASNSKASSTSPGLRLPMACEHASSVSNIQSSAF